MDIIHIVAAEARDWQVFLSLATAEGWRVPLSEIAFHRRSAGDSAWAMRCGEETIGFVTAVQHQRSGWIGNLLIAPHRRGFGHGARLFDAAVQKLRDAGATSLWLTASTQGAPLYARRGFAPVGEVVRWVRPQGGDGIAPLTATSPCLGLQADAEFWGERRSALLRHLGRNGQWLLHDHGLALLQRNSDMQILGPWYALSAQSEPERMADAVVALAEPGVELVVDLIDQPAGRAALDNAGFTAASATTLMATGSPLPGSLERILALATLGSCG